MRVWMMIVGLGSLLLMAGCATDNDSSMPWNTPQSWEGAPGIPGFSAPDR